MFDSEEQNVLVLVELVSLLPLIALVVAVVLAEVAYPSEFWSKKDQK